MAVQDVALPAPLVIGHKSDGRCVYSRASKQALVEACLRPGVSIARTARQHDLNANVLRRWIMLHQRGQATGAAPIRTESALVPVAVVEADSPLSVQRRADPAVVPSIEIVIGATTIRVCGAVDVGQLRCVLDCVRAL